MKHILTCLGMAMVILTTAGSAMGISMIPGDPAACFSWTYVGETDFDDPAIPGEADGGIRIGEVSVMALLPMFEPDGWTIGIGITGDWYRFTFPDRDDITGVDAYAIGVPVFAALNTGRWELWTSILPGLFSDFRDLGGADFKTQFHCLAGYSVCSTLALSLGLAYDSAFGAHKMYPIGGAVWEPSPRLSVRLVLPEASCMWLAADGLLLTVAIQPAGGEWHMYDEEDNTVDYGFREESWRSGLSCEVRLAGPLWLQVAGGLDFARTYRIEGSGTELLSSNAGDTWFMRMMLNVRP
ncbi:hypothetical protein JW905_05740 [bacterium]|nr:hypothetical protein [candidate division CSSED10-310 bacterium]